MKKYYWDHELSEEDVGKGSPHGRGCKPPERFLEDLRKLNDTLEVVTEYKGSAFPIMVRCKVCSYQWETKAGYLRTRPRCPRCVHEKRMEVNRRKRQQAEEAAK